MFPKTITFFDVIYCCENGKHKKTLQIYDNNLQKHQKLAETSIKYIYTKAVVRGCGHCKRTMLVPSALKMLIKTKLILNYNA